MNIKQVLSVSLFGGLLLSAVLIVSGQGLSRGAELLGSKVVKAGGPGYGYTQSTYMYIAGSLYTNGLYQTRVAYFTNQTPSGSMVKTTIRMVGNREIRSRSLVGNYLTGAGEVVDNLSLNTLYEFTFYSSTNGRGKSLATFRYTTPGTPQVPAYGYATIYGRVVEKVNGVIQPLANAKLEAKNQTVYTNEQGKYIFSESIWVPVTGETINLYAFRPVQGYPVYKTLYVKAGEYVHVPDIDLTLPSYGYVNVGLSAQGNSSQNFIRGQQNQSVLTVEFASSPEVDLQLSQLTFVCQGCGVGPMHDFTKIRLENSGRVLAEITPKVGDPFWKFDLTNNPLIIPKNSIQLLTLKLDLHPIGSVGITNHNFYVELRAIQVSALHPRPVADSFSEVRVTGLPLYGPTHTIKTRAVELPKGVLTIIPDTANTYTVNKPFSFKAYWDSDGVGSQPAIEVTSNAIWQAQGGAVGLLHSTAGQVVPGAFVAFTPGQATIYANYQNLSTTYSVNILPSPVTPTPVIKPTPTPSRPDVPVRVVPDRVKYDFEQNGNFDFFDIGWLDWAVKNKVACRGNMNCDLNNDGQFTLEDAKTGEAIFVNKYDFSRDGKVTIGDLQFVESALINGTYNTRFDVNDDGYLNQVDITDMQRVIRSTQGQR